MDGQYLTLDTILLIGGVPFSVGLLIFLLTKKSMEIRKNNQPAKAPKPVSAFPDVFYPCQKPQTKQRKSHPDKPCLFDIDHARLRIITTPQVIKAVTPPEMVVIIGKAEKCDKARQDRY